MKPLRVIRLLKIAFHGLWYHILFPLGVDPEDDFFSGHKFKNKDNSP